MSGTVAETIWYQEDSASPLTVAKPASFGPGQMLVLAFIQHNNPSAQTDLTTPAGWTVAGALDGVLADGKVFYYTYTGSDPASWDFGYRSTADVVAGLFRITGADVTTPTLVVATTPTASVTSPMDSPTVTPTGPDDLLLALISDICNGTVLAATAPAGMTDLGLGEVTGHFMSSRAAYEQLASGSATGVRTWTSVSPTGITGGTWTIAIKSAAAGVSSATPAPLVATTITRPTPVTPILLRSTLQDPPVLTTPGPLVIAAPARPRPAVVWMSRTAAVDVSAVTPAPIVAAPPAKPRPGFAVLTRSTLADDPVLTTPGPIVVAAPTRPRYATVLQLRSSLEDVAAAPTASTPQPITVAVPVRSRPGMVLLSRGSLFDATTPAPMVVTPTPTPRANSLVLLLRAPAADPVLAGAPPPIVVASPRPRPGGVSTTVRSVVAVIAPAVLGPDVRLVVGEPEPKWSAGGLTSRWAAADPAPRWTTGTPEV